MCVVSTFTIECGVGQDSVEEDDPSGPSHHLLSATPSPISLKNWMVI